MNNINNQIANVFETFNINNKVKSMLKSMFVIGLSNHCKDIYESVNLVYRINSKRYDTELLDSQLIFLISKDIFDNLNPNKIDNTVYNQQRNEIVINNIKRQIKK